jgi:RHS repeat-associated protein
VDWVWRKVVGESLVDSIIKPITGDFEKIAQQAGEWKNVKDALQAIRNNLNAGLSELQPAWDGDAANQFRNTIATTWTLGIEADAQAANLIGFALGKVADGSKRACDQCLHLIKMLVDKLIEAAAMLPIPVVGWGRAVKLVYDGIQIYNAIMQLINGIKMIINGAQQVIQGIQQVGTALSKIKDIHNLNDALTVANQAGQGVANIHSGAQNIGTGATQTTHAAGSLAQHGLSAADNAHGLRDERAAAARDRGGTERAGNTSMRANTGDERTESRPRVCVPGSGEPVDVATGQVFLKQTDAELPGVLPLVLDRTHFSAYRVGRLFGPSWTSTMDQRLEVETDAIYFAGADGARLIYPHPAADGSPVMPREGARLPLARGAGGDYTITDQQTGHTRHFPYVTTGLAPLAAIVDRNGNRIDIVHGQDGVPVEIRHSGGYRIAISGDGGRITGLRLRNPSGGGDIVLARFGYDQAGNLAEVINSSGLPFRFRYDPAGRLTGWEDRNGQSFTYVYDVLGRCARTEGSGGALTGSWEYREELTRYTDSLGHVTEYHLNDRMQVVRQVDPLGNATAQEWDRYHRLLSGTDPLGNTTRYTYDEAGNLLSITDPDGSGVRSTYTESGQPTLVTDAVGAVWQQTYDERGNLEAVTDPLGATTRYTHDERGHIATITDALGAVRRLTTNAAGLPVESIDAVGAVTRYERDLFGRIMAIVDPQGGVTRYAWSVEGKLLSRVRPDGARETWSYDGEGNRTRYIDPAGFTTVTSTTHFDQPATERGSDGSLREFGYDSELRLTSVTNTAGLTWRYEYDAAGHLVAETDFNGRRLAYAYDAAGRLTERTNGAGQVVRFVRDALGQVVERHSPEGSTRFGYDAAGRITRATNTDADVVYERDALGRVLAETVNGRTLSFRYDALGRCTRRVTPTGAVSEWSYDAAHLPAALRTAGHTLTFGYDRLGREVERIIDTGTVLTQSWDPGDRLTGQTVATGSEVLQQRGYRYRPDGYLTAITERVGGSRAFELDPAGRIAAVRGTGWTERYAYDDLGNTTAAAWSAAQPDDQGDREVTGTLLRRAGSTHYEYDRQGRVTARLRRTLSGQQRTWTYTWDSDDRLSSVSTPDGTVWRYRYDPFGRRIAKQRLAADATVAEQTDFTWDSNVLAEQVTGARATTWDTQPGDTRPLTQLHRTRSEQEWVDAEFYAIVTDLIGTPTELVDPAGRLAYRASTTVWGAVLGTLTNTADTPLRLPGQYHDPETGWHYNLHRYYDPQTARYASGDPLGLAPAPNPHTYVHNPTVRSDPLGLAPSCQTESNNETEPHRPSHRDLTSPSGKQTGYDSHHIIQNAAVRDLPGYDRDDAPAIALRGPSTDPSTEHYRATQAQRQPGGGTYGAERQIAYNSLIAAGKTPAEASAAVARADAYFKDQLGVTDSTPTRIPGNRRSP